MSVTCQLHCLLRHHLGLHAGPRHVGYMAVTWRLHCLLRHHLGLHARPRRRHRLPRHASEHLHLLRSRGGYIAWRLHCMAVTRQRASSSPEIASRRSRGEKAGTRGAVTHRTWRGARTVRHTHTRTRTRTRTHTRMHTRMHTRTRAHAHTAGARAWRFRGARLRSHLGDPAVHLVLRAEHQQLHLQEDGQR